MIEQRSQDGGGIGRRDHFLFYKFIERTTEQWTKLTKQLLIASSEHQAPRKAAHCLRREGKKICFSFFFFSFFLFLSFFFFFFFSFFFLYSFLSFILLVFLSYLLLKSSNTPLLFLNFHFHLNITLQKKRKKKKKKKRERSPIFKLNSIYISKFWGFVFVFVFKYFISNSLTSTLNLLIFVYQYMI